MNDDSQVIDAEVVDETPDEETQVPAPTTIDGASVVLNLESMIKTTYTGLADRRTKLKQYKEMLASHLKNDGEYQEAEAEAKKTGKVLKEIRSRLMKQSNAIELSEKVKDLSSEIKEMDAAISDYAREYERLSGSREIVNDEGEILEITYVAKLLKKGHK